MEVNKMKRSEVLTKKQRLLLKEKAIKTLDVLARLPETKDLLKEIKLGEDKAGMLGSTKVMDQLFLSTKGIIKKDGFNSEEKLVEKRGYGEIIEKYNLELPDLKDLLSKLRREP
jgi:hypothetical protein